MPKHTLHIKVDAKRPDPQLVGKAAEIIRGGGTVAFPTETVYGLGANALDARAVADIFRAKGRPADNPLIVHIAAPAMVEQLAADIPVPARRVMEVFWPGPLTVVLPRQPVVPDAVTGGLDTVAVRMPDHPVALALIRAAGVPVAAPSANLSGRPSPTGADHVLEDLAGRIDAVLDSGPCRVGVESTVLDLTAEPPVILRPGGVTREELEGVLGHVTEAAGAGGATPDPTAPRSPGMKYTHYAPRARMVLVALADHAAMRRHVAEMAEELRQKGQKVGILATDETASFYRVDEVVSLGSREDLATVSRNIYGALRQMDQKGVDAIICEGFPAAGLGTAVMNRLAKAAGGNVITH
ncbi:MAG: L-threonylcarbamoyladenylate synthase [Bacillota bacterium]